jgi:hypothetical protein
VAEFRNANAEETVINAESAFATADPPPRIARDRIYETRAARIIMTVTGVICLLIWGVIGFLVWLPLMSRMITAFSAAVMSAMMTGRDPSDAKNLLDYAATFYVRGFMLITDAMHGTLQRSGPYIRPSPRHASRMFTELVFCLLFWIGMFVGWTIWAQRIPFASMFTSIQSAYATVAPSIALLQLHPATDTAPIPPADPAPTSVSVTIYPNPMSLRHVATGMKDKTDREIFVGDVVRWADPVSNVPAKYVVRRADSKFYLAWAPFGATSAEIKNDGPADPKSVEVIGKVIFTSPTNYKYVID